VLVLILYIFSIDVEFPSIETTPPVVGSFLRSVIKSSKCSDLQLQATVLFAIPTNHLCQTKIFFDTTQQDWVQQQYELCVDEEAVVNICLANY